MKKSLNFNIQFSNLMKHSFPNCFAAVYVYLEKIFGALPKKCNNGESWCFGCACPDNADPQSVYFVLFDTLCGRSSLYWHFDGTMTNMAARIGDESSAGNWSGLCGTDYTADFLFGFAGYEYSKIIDTAIFKKSIANSIDADKPVLAERATDGVFCVITGYDGDVALCTHYHTNQENNTQEKRTFTLSYDEIKTVYLFGNKVAPRYTLKDGLERITRVIESSFSENVWDNAIDHTNKVLVTPTDDEYKNTDADELRAFRNRVTETFTNQFNCHIFDVAFYHLPKAYEEARQPALLDLWDELSKHQARLHSYAFSAGHLNHIKIANIGLFRIGLAQMFITAIEDIKETHMKMLEVLKRAIDVLN
ncbi:MAG: hypothetical protein FWC71_02105 [Defluviitaleaceae bacterium]|nr:hypothetical protein [Defluviitaleaceae bacterium]